MRKSIFRSAYVLMLVHGILWIVIFSFPLLVYNIRIFDKDFYSKEITNDLFLILLFYLNAYYFVPRFFRRKRMRFYFMVVLLSFLTISLEQLTVEYIFLQEMEKKDSSPAIYPLHRERPFDDMTADVLFTERFRQRDSMSRPFSPPGYPSREFSGGRRRLLGMPAFIFFATLRKALLSCLVVLLTGSFIKLSSEWFSIEQKKEELEKEKLNAELTFLKSQINPHFLFNSLNSIYALINEQSEKSGSAVLSLSDMMRYMIYDSNTEKVSLISEIRYLKNYISLQQLRLPDKVSIRFDVKLDSADLLIVPLLILPFIENAFKHGISYMEPCSIDIKILLKENGLLNVMVKNRIMPVKTEAYTGGFGLDNVRKRLSLHYPGKYALSINMENEVFIVDLNLQLHEHKVYDNR